LQSYLSHFTTAATYEKSQTNFSNKWLLTSQLLQLQNACKVVSNNNHGLQPVY